MKTLSASLLAMTLAGSAWAAPITTNPTLTGGGTTFDGLGCSVITGGLAGPTTCSEIDVSNVDGSLHIQSDTIAIGAAFIDAILTYHVKATEAISAVGMWMTATFLGNGVTSVIEEIYSDAARTNLVGRLAVNCFNGSCDSAAVGDPALEPADIPLSGEFTELWVIKDIQARGFVEGDLASQSLIRQVFDTVPVPEPSTLALVGGFLILGGMVARAGPFKA